MKSFVPADIFAVVADLMISLHSTKSKCAVQVGEKLPLTNRNQHTMSSSEFDLFVSPIFLCCATTQQRDDAPSAAKDP